MNWGLCGTSSLSGVSTQPELALCIEHLLDAIQVHTRGLVGATRHELRVLLTRLVATNAPPADCDLRELVAALTLLFPIVVWGTWATTGSSRCTMPVVCHLLI
jgi:hypothetical protein